MTATSADAADASYAQSTQLVINTLAASCRPQSMADVMVLLVQAICLLHGGDFVPQVEDDGMYVG